MSRNELQLETERKGFWKPFRVTVILPSGLMGLGRGWSELGALSNAFNSNEALKAFMKELIK